jgi:hypothetical protein
LDNDTSITKTRYYGDKCYAQDKEIDLLWKKVREYEHYGDIEKHLKNVAIQELIKVKDKLRETFEAGNLTEEGDIKPNPSREWRKVWKEKEVQRSAGSTSSNKVWGTSWKEKDGKRVIESGWVEKEKEEEPRIMMIRVQSLEEREEQRIAEFQEKGRQLDEEYNEMIRTHNEGQENLNKVARDCELKPNQEGLVEALIEQVIFDNQTRKKYDDVYQKERNLRREVTSYIQRKSLQIPEEPPQPSRWTLKPDEPSRREEIRQAQHQAQRTPVKWPPLPEKETPWTMPPKGTMLQRNDAMQAESSLKRPRESIENIKVKMAPMSGPPKGIEGGRIPTFKAPPPKYQRSAPPPP